MSCRFRARREARDRIRSADRPGRQRRSPCDYRVVEAAPRAVLRQADRGAPREGRARLDAEPGRIRALLVSLPRLPAREAADVDDDRRARRARLRSATASSVERRDEDGQTTLSLSSGRAAQHVSHDDGRRSVRRGRARARRAATTSRSTITFCRGARATASARSARRRKMIEHFEKRIGTPYPYARYSQIAVTDFIFGGMENTAATTQTDRTLHDETAHLDFSSDPLVSHELAHQWFGDLLTCRDWAHAWLNEGFATFMEAVWREADLGYDEYLYDIFECLTAYLRRGRRALSPPDRLQHVTSTPIEIFDRHLYQKGAAVLHMLRGELGDARFWRAIARYVETTRNATSRRSTSCARSKSATGRNLRGFFSQWVFRAGHPEARGQRGVGRRAQGRDGDDRSEADRSTPSIRLRVRRRDRIRARSRHCERAAGPRARRARTRDDRRAARLRTEAGAVRSGRISLGDVTYALGPDLAAAALRDDPNVVARIRAARELAKDGGAPRARRSRGVRARAVLGRSGRSCALRSARRARRGRARVLDRRPVARHPKVVRAAADALGNFRDAGAAAGAHHDGAEHTSYFVRAAALTALGKTRDPRAFDVLRVGA